MDRTSALRKLDDILTTLIVDKLSLWFATRKFKPKDTTLRKVKGLSLTEEIKTILFLNIIQKTCFKVAVEQIERLFRFDCPANIVEAS